MPLIPAFQLRLGNAILPNLATVGKYDGKHPSLTCATAGGRVFVHSPFNIGDDEQLRFLNFGQRVTALAAAKSQQQQHGGRDCLFVGSPTSLLLYDVQENADVFFRDVDEGVSAIAVGRIGSVSDSTLLAVVGGACNVQGFDSHGEERFWSVTGDNVTAMALFDVNGDGSRDELLVGSEDCAIRVFRGDEVVGEITEADVVTGLCPLQKSIFGYALANGTAGAYDGRGLRREWRVKSRNVPVCIAGFDLDEDGVPELVIGWSNGRLEVRSDKGDLVYRDQFSAPLAALTAADYRMDGKLELIACSADGEVRGYIPTKPGAQGSLLDRNVVEETLANLVQRKQQLEFELKHFEDVARGLLEDEKDTEEDDADDEGEDGEGEEEEPPEEAQTDFTATARIDPSSKHISVVLRAPTGLLVHSAVIFGDQTFSAGSLFARPPSEPTAELVIPVAPQKNHAEELAVRAFLGPLGSTEFRVAEGSVRLPKYAMFAQVAATSTADPSSHVAFSLGSERPSRVAQWIRDNFSISSPLPEMHVDVSFISLRDGKPLHITFADAKMVIATDDIDLAGDIIQDVCEPLRITELDTAAVFPQELEAFRGIVASVGEYNQARLKLTAEMADSANLVKTLLVKAEDSRMLSDMRGMKMAYTTLYEIDRELVGEFRKRENNQAALMRALKEMNQTIQRAARLRVGSAKGKILGASRDAILSNSIESLFRILRIGS